MEFDALLAEVMNEWFINLFINLKQCKLIGWIKCEWIVDSYISYIFHQALIVWTLNHKMEWILIIDFAQENV